MNKSLFLGLWKYLVRIPRPVWQGQVERGARSNQASLVFMSPDHHKIRDFVVLALPARGAPLGPEEIAAQVGLPLQHTREILDELEQKMTFLFRNERGEVAWAYPVTVEPTPHRIHFSSGEQVYAA
jgi:hypothetical protein